MATQDFERIIRKVLQPYQAQFAQAGSPTTPSPATAQKPPPVMTKEEIESERNRLLADSVSPEVFDKMMAMMNKTADNTAAVLNLPKNENTLSFPMPTPLAKGGPTYSYGEAGPEVLVTPSGRQFVIGTNGPQVGPLPTGYVVPHEEAFHGGVIPRQHGGFTNPFFDPTTSLRYQMRHGGVHSALDAVYKPRHHLKNLAEEHAFINRVYGGGGGGGGGGGRQRYVLPPREEKLTPPENWNPKTGEYDVSARGWLERNAPWMLPGRWSGQPGITPESRSAAGWYPDAFKHYTADFGVDPRAYNVIPGERYKPGTEGLIPTWPNGQVISREPFPYATPRQRGGKTYSTWDQWNAETEYDPDFELAEQTYGIPKQLLKAQAWKESMGDPWAMGKKGERGMFQILPSTENPNPATGYRGLTHITHEDPITQHILRAASYLKDQLKPEEGGDWKNALMRYNMGPRAFSERELPARRGAHEQAMGYANDILGWFTGARAATAAPAVPQRTSWNFVSPASAEPLPKEVFSPYVKETEGPVIPVVNEPSAYDRMGLRNQIRSRMGRPLVPEAPSPIENLLGGQWNPPADWAERLDPITAQIYNAAMPPESQMPGAFAPEGEGGQALRDRWWEPGQWTAPKIPPAPVPPSQNLGAPSGWTEQELIDYGFKKGQKPFGSPWAVEVIRGPERIMTPQGPRWLPSSRHMAVPGGEIPIPAWERQVGAGVYSPDYKPQTFVGVDAEGNQVLNWWNPATGQPEVVSRTKAPTLRDKIIEKMLTEPEKVFGKPPERPLTQGEGTPLYEEWKKQQAQYDANMAMVRDMLIKLMAGDKAPKRMPTWEQFYRDSKASGMSDEEAQKDYLDLMEYFSNLKGGVLR